MTTKNIWSVPKTPGAARRVGARAQTPKNVSRCAATRRVLKQQTLDPGQVITCCAATRRVLERSTRSTRLCAESYNATNNTEINQKMKSLQRKRLERILKVSGYQDLTYAEKPYKVEVSGGRNSGGAPAATPFHFIRKCSLRLFQGFLQLLHLGKSEEKEVSREPWTKGLRGTRERGNLGLVTLQHDYLYTRCAPDDRFQESTGAGEPRLLKQTDWLVTFPCTCSITTYSPVSK